jgi:hypothetical protein
VKREFGEERGGERREYFFLLLLSDMKERRERESREREKVKTFVSFFPRPGALFCAKRKETM